MNTAINTESNISIELIYSFFSKEKNESNDIENNNKNIKFVNLLENVHIFIKIFFIISGCVFTKKFLLFNLFILGFLFYGIYLSVEIFIFYHSYIGLLPNKELFLGYLFGFNFLFQSFISIYTIYTNYKYVTTPIDSTKIPNYCIYDKSFIYSSIFWVISFLISCILPFYNVLKVGGYYGLLYLVIEFFEVNILSVNLYTILLYIKEIDENIDLFIMFLKNKENCISDEDDIISNYKILKNKCDNIINKLFKVVNLTIFCSCINIFFIFYNIFVSTYKNIYFEISGQSFFVKNVFILFYLLWVIGNFNDKSSTIIDILATSTFKSNFQIQQLLAYNYILTKKIQFLILGKNFSKIESIKSFTLFIITILFSFVKKFLITTF
jgi:hypothetical protein